MTTQFPPQTGQGELKTEFQPESKVSILGRFKKWAFNGYSGLVYLFLYAPIIVLVIYSFNVSRFPTYWSGFTLDWYRVLFNDHLVGLALKNTLIVSFTSMIISTIIGTMIAIGVERYKFKSRSVVDGLLFLPIIIPDIAMAIMLLVFFNLINMNLGLSTIIIAHIAFNISFVAIIVRARMASLSITMEEAAGDLYANEWKTFWRVTFPLLTPGILGGALFAFTLSLDDYVVTNFTSGPGSTTLPVRIIGMTRRNITPEINALSTMMLFSAMALVLLSIWLQRRENMS